MRIRREGFDFREVVSTVLTFDYVGALAASLLFPLLLVPYLGMIRTGFLFGIANAGVALALLMILPRRAELRLEKVRSEEHTSELQSLMRISYAVFCLKNKKKTNTR